MSFLSNMKGKKNLSSVIIRERTWLILLFFVIIQSVETRSQPQPPFILTVTGGLFFPSYLEFEKIYQSHSDAIWGIGVCLPVDDGLYLTGDYSFFHSDGFFDRSIDSAARLEENFIHAGLLKKYFLGQRIFLRMSGGLNYVTIRQKTSSPRSSEQVVDAGKKIGYFCGIGLEQSVHDGKLSLFVDALYDYRRSAQKELTGDFGGIRLVLGVHIFLM